MFRQIRSPPLPVSRGDTFLGRTRLNLKPRLWRDGDASRRGFKKKNQKDNELAFMEEYDAAEKITSDPLLLLYNHNWENMVFEVMI